MAKRKQNPGLLDEGLTTFVIPPPPAPLDLKDLVPKRGLPDPNQAIAGLGVKGELRPAKVATSVPAPAPPTETELSANGKTASGSSGGGGKGSGGNQGSSENPQDEAKLALGNMLAGLLPYMTPEDKRTLANTIYLISPDDFSQYGPDFDPGPIPGEVSSEFRDEFTSSGRGGSILDFLDSYTTDNEQILKDNKGLSEGINFLKIVTDSVRDYGAAGSGDSLTRRQEELIRTSIKPFLDKNEGGAFYDVARMIALPFVSAEDVFKPESNLKFN